MSPISNSPVRPTPTAEPVKPVDADAKPAAASPVAAAPAETDGQVLPVKDAVVENPTAEMAKQDRGDDKTYGVGGVLAAPFGGFGIEAGAVIDGEDPGQNGFYVNTSVRTGAEASVGLTIGTTHGGDAEGVGTDASGGLGMFGGSAGMTETGEATSSYGVGLGGGASGGVGRTFSFTNDDRRAAQENLNDWTGRVTQPIEDTVRRGTDAISNGVDGFFDASERAADWLVDKVENVTGLGD